MHPLVAYCLRQARSQVKHLVLLLPMAGYLILLIVYPIFQLDVMGREHVTCTEKSALIQLDEQLFEPVYDFVSASENKPFLVFCGLPYFLHFGSSGLYILYLLWKRPGWYYFWLYGLTLGITSLSSIILQYSMPTPPPWLFNHLPPEAKFHLVDEYLHIKLYHGIYGLNKLICGSFPSIHVQWPSIIAHNGVVHPFFGLFYVVWISTAAIYSSHHWVNDVIFGLLIAFASDRIGKLCLKR